MRGWRNQKCVREFITQKICESGTYQGSRMDAGSVLFIFVLFILTLVEWIVFQATYTSPLQMVVVILWLVICLVVSCEPRRGKLPCHLINGLIVLALQSAILTWIYLMNSDATSYPCGASSCSGIAFRNDNPPIPYVPEGGYFHPWAPYIKACPWHECRWGDVTGCPPTGYPGQTDNPLEPNITTSPCLISDSSCASLATQRPQDYCDLGNGLHLGFYEGVTTRDLAHCPFVDVTAKNPQGIYGKGLEICSPCTWYIARKYGGRIPGNCPEPKEGMGLYFCEQCSQFSVNQDSSMRLATLIITSVILGLSGLFYIIEGYSIAQGEGGR